MSALSDSSTHCISNPASIKLVVMKIVYRAKKYKAPEAHIRPLSSSTGVRRLDRWCRYPLLHSVRLSICHAPRSCVFQTPYIALLILQTCHNLAPSPPPRKSSPVMRVAPYSKNHLSSFPITSPVTPPFSAPSFHTQCPPRHRSLTLSHSKGRISHQHARNDAALAIISAPARHLDARSLVRG